MNGIRSPGGTRLTYNDFSSSDSAYTRQRGGEVSDGLVRTACYLCTRQGRIVRYDGVGAAEQATVEAIGARPTNRVPVPRSGAELGSWKGLVRPERGGARRHELLARAGAGSKHDGVETTGQTAGFLTLFNGSPGFAN